MRKLIIGLGNPGVEYQNTRHNVGFMALDKLNETYGLSNFQTKFNSEYVELAIKNHKAILLKPLTYMNLSGQAIAKVMQFYKIPLKDLIVIHDDIDLEVGKIRVKTGGSSGGHNGLKSIDELIGKEYQRIRIGVSRPTGLQVVSTHVLAKFKEEERNIIDNSILAIIENINILLLGDADKFMSSCAIVINKFKKE